MPRKNLGFGISLVITILFLVLSPGGCAFNFIPYSMNEEIFKDAGNEIAFIRIFDIACAIILFWLLYMIFKKVFKN